MTARGPIRIELHPCEKPHEYDQLIESLAVFLEALAVQRKRDLAPRGPQSIGEALVATVESALAPKADAETRKRGPMSPQARERIRAAALARWARAKAGNAGKGSGGRR